MLQITWNTFFLQVDFSEPEESNALWVHVNNKVMFADFMKIACQQTKVIFHKYYHKISCGIVFFKSVGEARDALKGFRISKSISLQQVMVGLEVFSMFFFPH